MKTRQEKRDEDGRLEEIKCACGQWVYVRGQFTAPCDCGRDYNWNGDLLAPRCQWGEETGETAAEILSAP